VAKVDWYMNLGFPCEIWCGYMNHYCKGPDIVLLGNRES
jgi:hypothetical protein